MDLPNFDIKLLTTKDGTQNEGGGGDIAAVTIYDTIYDDWLSEDYYWSAQAHITANGKTQ